MCYGGGSSFSGVCRVALLEALHPPYDRSLDPKGVPAPLGAVFVCHTDGAGGLRSIDWTPVRQSPWCPLAVAEGPNLPLAVVLALRSLPNDIVPFGPLQKMSTPLEAVRIRPGPDPATFCGYLDLRVAGQTLAPAVLRCLEGTPETGLPRTLHRRLAQPRSTDGLHASDWRHLWRLTSLAPRPDESVAMLADRYGADERTLRAHLGRLIGMSPSEFRARIGCEWVIEAALRRHGFVRQPGAGSA